MAREARKLTRIATHRSLRLSREVCAISHASRALHVVCPLLRGDALRRSHAGVLPHDEPSPLTTSCAPPRS